MGGLSAIIWLAIGVGIAMLGTGEATAPKRADLAVAGLVALAALAPVSTASDGALTLLALWAMATAPRGAALFRAGIIFLSVTTSLLWGRVLLALGSRPILDIDAWLSGWLIGTHGEGNRIYFADGSGFFLVAPGCSSLQSISLAVVFWAVVTQHYRLPIDRRAILICVAAIFAAIAVNVLRLASLAHFPQHFSELHVGWGLHVFGWLGLAAIVTTIMFGFRNSLFARR